MIKKNKFLKALFILKASVLMTATTAMAQYGGGYGGQGRPGRQVIDRQLNMQIRGPQLIMLGRQFQIRQHRGKVLRRVVVNGSSAAGRGSAQLLVNGSPVGPAQTLQRGGSRLVFQLYENQNVIGRDIQRLQLQVRARNGYISNVRAVVRGGNRIQNVSQYLGMTFNSGERIRVRRQLGLQQQHNGKKVHSITVNGQKMGQGPAILTLLINGQQVGVSQRIGRRFNQATFQLPMYNQNILGQDIRTIQIQVQGSSLYVSQLSAQVSGGQGGYGRPVINQPPVVTGPQRPNRPNRPNRPCRRGCN